MPDQLPAEAVAERLAAVRRFLDYVRGEYHGAPNPDGTYFREAVQALADLDRRPHAMPDDSDVVT